MPEENINKNTDEENVTKKSVEQWVKEINYYNDIELEDTIKLMTSDDYKVRFLAEYLQTKIRYNNLHRLVIKMEAGALDFVPDTPLIILKEQKSYMGQYLYQLEIRAIIEKIPLPKF